MQLEQTVKGGEGHNEYWPLGQGPVEARPPSELTLPPHHRTRGSAPGGFVRLSSLGGHWLAVEHARCTKKSPPRIPEAGTLVTELAFAPRRVRLPCELVEGGNGVSRLTDEHFAGLGFHSDHDCTLGFCWQHDEGRRKPLKLGGPPAGQQSAL